MYHLWGKVMEAGGTGGAIGGVLGLLVGGIWTLQAPQEGCFVAKMSLEALTYSCGPLLDPSRTEVSTFPAFAFGIGGALLGLMAHFFGQGREARRNAPNSPGSPGASE